MMSIRNVFLSLGLTSSLLAGVLAPAGLAQIQIQSTLVQAGLTEPLYVCSPPGDTHRLFVVEHRGVIRIIKDGVLLGTPFLNLDPIITGGTGSNEQGMLGLAFHPDYANNGKFYVDYIDLGSDAVLREYVVSGNPDVADASSFTTLFGPYSDPQSNHNGGCLQFGPDGMLYFGLGDGGNANDSGSGHTEPTGNAQSMSTYFGKMLRLDVGNPPTYEPAGNPFPGSAIPLTWTLGWRNPWRFSFDRLTGDMYVGDVGQNAREEISFQSGTSTGGENYGWRCMEGTLCTGLTGCTCNSPSLKLPIREYDNSSVAWSIIGGYVYRGSAIPALQGHYIHADYGTSRIWSFTYSGGVVSNFADRTTQLDPPGALAITRPTSFGEDADGEVYICDFVGGEIYRIDPVCPTPTTYCVGATNSTGSGAFMGFNGSGSIADNDLQLLCFGTPPNKFGLFYYGQGTAMAPAYNGFRCIANTFHRLPTLQTDINGDASFNFDVTAPPAVVTVGSTWNFQFFYRDPGVGAGANYSDALSVTFCAQ